MDFIIPPERKENFRKFLETFRHSWIRVLDDKGARNGNIMYKLDKLHLCCERLEEFNKKGHAIFFMPNKGDKGTKKENITEINWVYAEIDHLAKEKQIEKIKAAPIEPDIIIETRNSYHMYWKVYSDGGESLSTDDFKNICMGLIDYFGSDATLKKENQLLRMPEFYHMKAEPYKVKIIHFDLKNEDGICSSIMREYYPYEPPKQIEKGWEPYAARSKINNFEDNALEKINNIPIDQEILKDYPGWSFDGKNFWNSDKSRASSAFVSQDPEKANTLIISESRWFNNINGKGVGTFQYRKEMSGLTARETFLYFGY